MDEVAARAYEGSMSQQFRPYEPDQGFLLPPSLRDWLPEDHLAYFISDTVDELDLSRFVAAYRAEGSGRVAYHPRLMLKVLVYAYCVGVFSSRAIARQIEENVAFRVLAADERPNHRTICRFRERHMPDFEGIFAQIVQIARGVGLVNLGALAIDGSKVKASASKHKSMSYERMEEDERRLRKQIRELTHAAQQEDEVEDQKYGPDFRGDELPEEIRRRKSRLEVIRRAKKRIEERKARDAAEKEEASGKPVDPKPKPKDQENFTDPDSRIMKTGSGAFEQCYNAQTAVDGASRLIVSVGLSQSAADRDQLLPLLDGATKNCGRSPGCVLADAGYRWEKNFEGLESRQVRGYISIGREGREPVIRSMYPATQRMQKRLKTKTGRKNYKRRKTIAEPVFGWIKNVLGFRSFGVRGFQKAAGEWNLVCLATNLRRLKSQLAWV